MKVSIPSIFLILLAALPLAVAAAEPEVIYWNSDAGKVLRARIAPDEDYWQLIPWFTEQVNQTYCSVASAGNQWGHPLADLCQVSKKNSWQPRCLI